MINEIAFFLAVLWGLLLVANGLLLAYKASRASRAYLKQHRIPWYRA